MKIKYQDKILTTNSSPWCIDCDLYKYDEINNCIRLCGKNETYRGFKIIDDCEVLKL